MDRYSDTTFLIRQITMQQQKLNHAWNHIKDHPDMANNDTISRQKEEFSQQFTIFYFKQKVKI